MKETKKVTISDLAVMIKSGFDDVHEKLGVVGDDVSILKKDVGVLKSDVGILKKDVSILRSDVDALAITTKNGFNEVHKKLGIADNKFDTLIDVLEENRAINSKEAHKIKLAVRIGE